VHEPYFLVGVLRKEYIEKIEGFSQAEFITQRKKYSKQSSNATPRY
jgi:hypothetical protein